MLGVDAGGGGGVVVVVMVEDHHGSMVISIFITLRSALDLLGPGRLADGKGHSSQV